MSSLTHRPADNSQGNVSYVQAMETEYLTVALPKELVAEARELAAKRNTSISTVFRVALLKDLAAHYEYEAAMKRQMAIMSGGVQLSNEGQPYPDRDSTHER